MDNNTQKQIKKAAAKEAKIRNVAANVLVASISLLLLLSIMNLLGLSGTLGKLAHKLKGGGETGAAEYYYQNIPSAEISNAIYGENLI